MKGHGKPVSDGDREPQGSPASSVGSAENKPRTAGSGSLAHSEDSSRTESVSRAADQFCAAGHCCDRSTKRPAELKSSLDTRLAKIEGQVRAIRRMIAEDCYCDDVLAQVSASRAALATSARLILEHHLHHCLVERIHEGDETIIDELMESLKRWL